VADFDVGEVTRNCPRPSIGVAMGTGTDVARESANVLLMGNDLPKLVETRWGRLAAWLDFR
jgi:high-affinity K+ transport system ATPase subunit B